MSSLDSLRIPEAKKTYIIQKLNPLLEDMVTECLTEMPNDPVEFMIKYLRENKSSGSKEAPSDSLQAENDQLKKEINSLREMLKHGGGDAQGTTDGDNDSVVESEDEDDDDYVDELPDNFVQSQAQRNKARASVSAEAYGAWNVKKEFTPPVYPKGDEQKARIKEVLSKSFLFAALENNDFAIVVDAMKEETVSAKERVINQGDDGDFLFVVESGELEVYKKFPGDEEEKMLKVCEVGDVFGELALLYNCPRAASIEAKTDCRLLRLDRETFNHIVKDAAAHKRERYESFLKSVPLLASMDAYERGQIADALKPVSVAAGEMVVKQGEPGDTFYVIEEGACEALKERDGGEQEVVCVLDGHSLTCEKLIELSKGNVELTLSPAAWDKVNRGRHVIDQILDKKEVAYGINTGFGMFSDVIVAPDQLSQLQVNLIRSHAAGVGPPLSRARTRMLLALRVNVIACGHSGARPETVEKMLAAFNEDCLSVVPCQGTVGASGDLAPLAHLCLGLLGEGLMWEPQSTDPKPAGEVLQRHGLEPLELGPKEGLALINGTQLISSLGCEAVMRSINVARCADVTCAITLEALMGTHNAFHPKIHAARPHCGQNLVASRIRGLLEPEKPSDLFDSHRYSGKVQDAYTLRCVPQVHGVVFETIEFVKRLLDVELNSATDNPMIFTGGADFYPTGSAKAPAGTRGRGHSGDASSTLKGSAATTPVCATPLSPIPPSQENSTSFDDSFPLVDGPEDASDISDLNDARKEIQKMRALLKNFKQENTALNTHLMETLLLGTSGFIISGGNFHGEYPAKALDYLAIGIQELANISERRMERLVNPALSNLPAFLVQNGGLNSGFMIAHCTAAALTSENKVLCHPSSVDTLSTSAAKEDHVSMGGYSARKCLEVISNVEVVIAIELMAACQALEFHRPCRSTAPLEAVYDLVRSAGVEPYDEDRYLAPDIDKVTDLIRSGAVWEVVEPYLKQREASQIDEVSPIDMMSRGQVQTLCRNL
ncbi:hypothetical protein FOZ63_016809 [Perkinsus olseni]|uniref:cAMP-dependent protein kinase regulatory subunit n=1 Tax=Perkinsus olseni TaxID=32597 RepID=A0A7J6PS65_PEROL|nr:hypothetical protein FOZ63_016809 [Perkinsus olseni]